MSLESSNISPEEIVSSLYEAILRRHPDNQGLLHHDQRIRAGIPLVEVVRDFVVSPESKLERVISLGYLDTLPPNVIELDLSSAQRQLLWEHLATVWSRLGRDDPYWSVLASEEFRFANMSRTDQIDRFFESGRFDVERAEKYLSRNSRCLPKHGVCVDYGCG